MNANRHEFTSRESVENWMEACRQEGLSSHLIFALILKKREELQSKKDFYLLKRREALVGGDTVVATELHLLMKECEQQIQWFSELGENMNDPLHATNRHRFMNAELKNIFSGQLNERKN
jgi:hypothetical protein